MSTRIRVFLRQNVLGLVAIFIALSGAAYAGPLKPNKVKTKHIADAAVTTPKLAESAVTTQKLADNSVTAGKVPADALGGADIDESSLSASTRRPAARRAAI